MPPLISRSSSEDDATKHSAWRVAQSALHSLGTKKIGTRTVMEGNFEERIRGLAQPLWESAARPYGMAMDFWLMAEQMVMEMVTATARLQSRTASPPPPPLGELPEGMPVARVRELAECMWESAGRQYGVAQEFWLSAERHVLAMLRVSAFPARDDKNAWAAEIANLSPAAYLERIRMMAYYYWEAAGRGYGKTLDCWLQAERDMLKMMSTATEGSETQPSPPADGVSPAGAPKGAAPTDLPTRAATQGEPSGDGDTAVTKAKSRRTPRATAKTALPRRAS